MEYFKGVVVKDLEVKWADITYPQAKESFSKAVWVPVVYPDRTVKREPIKSDRDWQSLPCCGGTCTRGICEFHNCPPEEK